MAFIFSNIFIKNKGTVFIRKLEKINNLRKIKD